MSYTDTLMMLLTWLKGSLKSVCSSDLKVFFMAPPCPVQEKKKKKKVYYCEDWRQMI